MRTIPWIVTVVAIAGLPVSAQLTSDALYAGILEGGMNEIATYLDAGGDPNTELRIPDADQRISVLELAFRARNEQAALLLLEIGANVDDPSLLVEWAAELGFSNVIEFLLDRYPGSVLAMRPDSHPLVIAVARGHRDVVRLLLERTAGMVGNAERQETLDKALMAAVASYRRETGGQWLVDDLLKAGASASRTLVLAGAVLQCDPELVSTFLNAGADPKKQYDAGRGSLTPVEYAIRCFERDDVTSETAQAVLRELTNAGADPCLVASRPTLPPALATIISRCPSMAAEPDE